MEHPSLEVDMLRSTLCVVALTGLTALTAGCSAGEPTATPSSKAPNTSTSTTSDSPIGGGDIDLGASSRRSYSPEQLSGPTAADCYQRGTRIYDRHGVTCAEAKALLTTYDASAAGRAGRSQRVGRDSCSHNPDVMVVQGAAPGSCLDDTQGVAFNWRYPGAPQPARG